MPDMHQTLQTLHMLLPAQGLLHIGAGLPNPGAWYQQWGLPTIDWIDASEQRHHLLAKHVLHQVGEGHRQSHHALLGADCAQAQYYVLSNPQESGLIDAAALTALWPNIATSSAVALQQSSLDTFAAQNLPHHAKANWLYIDCLPALRIVQGANKQLQHTDVIVARTVVAPLAATHPLNGLGATLGELSAHLQPLGYRLLTTYEERNPALATAIYVRDYVQALHTTRAELQTQLRQAQATHAEMLQKQEQLAQAHKALEADLLNTTKGRDAEAQAKAELQTQLQRAQAAHAELMQKQEQLTQNHKALEASFVKKTEEATQLEHRFQKLQAEHQETTHRQQLMDEELLKAETQIELIKDLLLREQAEPSIAPQKTAP